MLTRRAVAFSGSSLASYGCTPSRTSLKARVPSGTGLHSAVTGGRHSLDWSENAAALHRKSTATSLDTPSWAADFGGIGMIAFRNRNYRTRQHCITAPAGSSTSA